MKTALFIALSMFGSQFAYAGGSAAAGADKVRLCVTCHGADLNTPITADIPLLAGQYADYVARALTDYKSGGRRNAVMNAQAEKLSAQDIQDLAAYINSLNGKLKVIPLHRLAH